MTLLRKRVVSLADMKLFDGLFPPSLEPKMHVKLRDWNLRLNVPHRIQAFICPLLRDFHYKWRHILRNPNNLVTLQVFARAFIRLSTLDFEVAN